MLLSNDTLNSRLNKHGKSLNYNNDFHKCVNPLSDCVNMTLKDDLKFANHMPISSPNAVSAGLLKIIMRDV